MLPFFDFFLISISSFLLSSLLHLFLRSLPLKLSSIFLFFHTCKFSETRGLSPFLQMKGARVLSLAASFFLAYLVAESNVLTPKSLQSIQKTFSPLIHPCRPFLLLPMETVISLSPSASDWKRCRTVARASEPGRRPGSKKQTEEAAGIPPQTSPQYALRLRF